MFNEGYEMKLVDFGTSKIIDSFDNIGIYEGKTAIAGSTTTGFQGTWSHMAPEMIVKRKRFEKFAYDPFKADMWSLGVTLY